MLSFATEFPVSKSTTVDEFLNTIRTWILGSPHTQFRNNDLVSLLDDKEFLSQQGQQIIRGLRASTPIFDIAAIRHRVQEEELEWYTTIVYRNDKIDAWVSVRTQVESLITQSVLPPAKKPRIVKAILENIKGGEDGILSVQSAPHYLSNDDIEVASSLISGTVSYYLPVVYVSVGFGGNYFVDVDQLSSDLAGMAHVVVEPNRPFSRRLQIEVSSTNVYGGAIGIYWPEASGRRAFFIGRNFDNSGDLRRLVADTVRNALVNRRPLQICSWSASEEAVSQEKIAALKNSGSAELDDYIEAFDKEIDAKDVQLLDAENEILRLRAEVRALEATSPSTSHTGLNLGTEQDFFPGEIQEIVYDAISTASENSLFNSRRFHVLNSIISNNKKTSFHEEIREEIKNILRHYKSMSKDTRSALEKIGFTISDEGKHYKLVYHDDERYTFSLAKTGSDHRGGLNSVSDISKYLL